MPVRARILATLCALSLAACDGGGNARFDVLVAGDAETAANAAVPLTQASALIREATGSGLVALDAQGRIRPDLAARWIVTDDGLSYIFRFERVEAGSDTMTASDVRKALLAAIDDLKGTGLGLDLQVIDGVFARTDEVIEIKLKTAMPEFLQLLAAPELALKLDDPSHALTLSVDGPQFTLATANAEDAPSLDVRVASPKEAVERFQAGQAELMLGGGLDGLPHVEIGGLLRGTIRLDPVAGLFGLAIVPGGSEFLSRASNREAISMAINRQSLIQPFGIGGWAPRSRLVPVGPPGTLQPPGRWDGVDVEERQAFAAQRVAGWVANEGAVPPITIALPEGSGGDILFRGLSASMSRIGIALERVGPDEKAQLRLVDEVAMLDRPEWYLHRLDCTVIRGACNEQADLLVAEAIKETEPQLRAQMLAEAENILTAENTFISFGPPIRFSLVRGGVEGFSVNRWGFHPLSQLVRDPT